MSIVTNFYLLGNDTRTLKYLQSKGNSWILTDIDASGTDDFTMECEVEFDEKKTNSYFFGTNLVTGHYYLYIRASNVLSTEVGSTYGQINFNYNIGVKYHIKINIKTDNGIAYKTTWINETKYENNIKCNVALAKSEPIRLFWVGYFNNIKMKFYSAKFYKDGELVADLVPCFSNGEPCMMDIKNRKRYYNSGTEPLSYQ